MPELQTGKHGNIIKIDVFTPNNEEISENDRKRIRKMFLRFSVSVALFLVSFFMTLVLGDLLCLLCALFMLFSSVMRGKDYYTASAGRGLCTSYIFSPAGFTVVNESDLTELPYSAIAMAVQRDDGLIVDQRDGTLHFIPIDAIDESEQKDRLYSLLKSILRNRYIINVPTEEEKEAEQALINAERNERTDILGKLITTVSYTVTGEDMRAYHRMTLKKEKKLHHVLVSVIGAFATVLPVMNGITGESIWYSLFCICLVILALLLIIPKFGLKLPAKLCFFAGKDEKEECYVHEKGMAVKAGKRRVLEKWENMEDVVFDDTEGIYADMGENCTVFLPADLMLEPVTALIKQAYEKAVDKDGTDKERA